jgi:8-oxo-dGTP diphosphatase
MKATVVYPMMDGKILLGKKTKKIGVGKWNGFGGKQEPQDRTIEETAARELWEETGKGIQGNPEDLELHAIIDFDNGAFVNFQVYFYMLKKFTGEFKDTDEMVEISWHDKDNMPYDGMLAADRLFVGKIFAGEKFSANIKYNEDMSVVELIEFFPLHN